MPDNEVVIIGGGITGLASAWLLEEAGYTRISLLEASGYIGGKIQTDRDSGFLVETGPDALMITKPGVREFIQQLGIEDQLIEPASRQFYILHDGKLQSVPAGFASMVPADMGAFLRSSLISLPGKARMLAERLVPARKHDKDESLAAFITRRFGREVLEQLAEPLFSGVYSAPADDLSIKATFPHFHRMEAQYGSITKAVLNSRKKQGPPASSPFRSFQNGMDTLPSTILNQLKHTQVYRNTPVEKLQKAGSGYILHTPEGAFETQQLISTIPAYRMAPAIEDLAPAAKEPLEQIAFASSAIVTLAYPRSAVANSLDATGFLIPSPEQTALSACTWSSEKWPDRAPEGYVTFRCFFSNIDPNLIQRRTHDEWRQLADQELKQILTIHGQPNQSWLHTWKDAQPQYKMGHLPNIERLDQQLKAYPGIHLAGSPYRGVGIPDCIRQAQATVKQIREQDQEPQPA